MFFKIDVICSISNETEESDNLSFSIVCIACITVLWSRPPKWILKNNL